MMILYWSITEIQPFSEKKNFNFTDPNISNPKDNEKKKKLHSS